MATILFDGTEFNISGDLTAGSVLGAACVRYGEPGDFFRFKLFDAAGHEVQPSELVGKRRLALCDVRKLRDYAAQPAHEDYRLAAAGK
jgi:hypothetical protein